ncbi:MAG: glycosyltransferase [Acidobacteria bacterium]|nr:glycosyltransferase [Acidobacteriota bacterium]
MQRYFYLIVLPVDLLLAWMLLLVNFLARGVPRAVLNRKRRNPAHEAGVLFYSHEGVAVAPSRVRCYHFSDALNRMTSGKANTLVFCHWDHVFGWHQIRPRNLWKTELAIAVIRSWNYMCRHRFVVVVDQRPNYHTLATLLYRITDGGRICVDVDDWIFNDWNYLLPIRTDIFLKWIRPMVDSVVVSTNPLAKKLEPLFPAVETIPTFADENIFRYQPAPVGYPFVFSWTGSVFSVEALENLLFVVDAAGMLECQPDKPYRLECLIIMDPKQTELNEQVKEILRSIHDQPQISVKSPVAPKDMPNYLAGVHCGLYILKSPSAFQQAKCPTRIFEYYAVGRPVIATATGAATEYVIEGETGYIVSSPEDLAQCMEKLLSKPEDLTSMGLRARAYVDRDWSITAAVDQYRRILDTSRSLS